VTKRRDALPETLRHCGRGRLKGSIEAFAYTINRAAFRETGLVIGGVSIPDSLIREWDMAHSTKPGPGARIP